MSRLIPDRATIELGLGAVPEAVTRALGSKQGLGVHSGAVGDGIANLRLGSHSFLLQDFFVDELAKNFMMHLLVDDLDRRWQHIDSLSLDGRFGVGAPRPPKPEPWGLRVA